MATRSRTFLFIQYRNSFGHAHRKQRAKALRTQGDRGGRGRSGTVSSTGSEREGLITTSPLDDTGDTLGRITPGLADASDVIIEMATLPPQWVDTTDEMNEKFDQIRNDIKYLDGLHKKHILPGFNDRREEEEEIESVTHSITQKFHECQELIRRISLPGDEGQEVALCKNIRIAMATKLQNFSSGFRKSQSEYLDKVQKLRTRSNLLFSSDTTLATDPSQERSFNLALTDEQIQAMQENDTVISERDREINEIATSIATVAEIFKDMQTMVIDQGTLLDRVDYNVEQVVSHVKKANEELDEPD
ncbi:t-SNARE affecting a late Golgi compartment protein 2 [Dispira simplex]|nr:t-SNARE affecting a late Golgi compartment protein 2 [Dispira simplex]